MNKIEIKKKSWKDCTIADYFEINELVNDETMQNYEKEVKLIAMLCNCDDSELWDLNIEQFKALQDQTNWIGEISLKNVDKLKFKKITINGNKYDINGDSSTFTVAQYIDFQTFWGKRNTLGMKDIIGNILVCFIIPHGKKYADGYDTNELAKELYNNLDIETAYEIISFFFKCWLRSIKNGLTSSAKVMMKMGKKMSKEEWSQLIAQMAETEQTLIDGFTSLTSSASLLGKTGTQSS